jgi:hypothetical protein
MSHVILPQMNFGELRALFFIVVAALVIGKFV